MSRQYVEMPRSRVEGLLTTFPKLLSAEKSMHRQHTFIETESVRYVYQPLDQLYVFLITTKTSNILEDLETLRLFSRVVPEYCKKADEKDVMDHVFELLFAFDEIVALGYRENINVSQVRTYVDMDSHDERVYYQIKKSQEEEARKIARDKARELAKAKQEAAKRGVSHLPFSNYGGFGPQIAKYEPGAVVEPDRGYECRPSAIKTQNKKPDSGKAMQLSAKPRADIFGSLDSDNQGVANGQLHDSRLEQTAGAGQPKEKIHVKLEETMNVKQKRDGGLDQLEVHGAMVIRISDESYGNIRIKIDLNDKRNIQMQAHPNMDKKTFQVDRILMLKNQSRPFPINTDASILKWRFQTTEESSVPLSINCWPSETRNGFDVNIEYVLEKEDLRLEDVCIIIPLPQMPSAPLITECDGEYSYDRAHQRLEWRLPFIDSSNKQGSLEFSTTTGSAASFFPVSVRFTSKLLFCDIKVDDIQLAGSGDTAKFSEETKLSTETYEVM